MGKEVDMGKEERYWLRLGTLPWQAATREQFIQAERAAGFQPTTNSDIATGGFTGGGIQGRITYGKITEENYSWDKEFFEAAKAASAIT